MMLVWAVIAYSTIFSHFVEGYDATAVDRAYVPSYTTHLSQINEAGKELNKNIKSKVPEGHRLHYLMITNALNELIDKQSKDGSVPNYDGIVDKAISETLNDPQAVARKIKKQVHKTVGKIAALKELIHEKQRNGDCKHPISHHCDMVIETAIQNSKDGSLKKQAEYLNKLAKQARIYLKELSQELVDVAHRTDAPTYLLLGKERLNSFIKAAANTRRSGKEMKDSKVHHQKE